EELVQIVAPDGTVVRASEELEGMTALGDFAPEAAQPRPDKTTDDDDDDDDDDDFDDDSDDSGTVASTIEYRTLTVAGEDGRYRFAASTVVTPDGKELAVYAGISLSTQD